VDTVSKFIQDYGVSHLVCDFSPLKISRAWKDQLVEKLKSLNSDCSIRLVDAHNVVPVWQASDKLETAARTIRPKITSQLSNYLTDFPELEQQDQTLLSPPMRAQLTAGIDWSKAWEVVNKQQDVAQVDWIVPGEDAAMQALRSFLDTNMDSYDSKRNDPNANGQSGLSPYLHFGQLSSQRAAWEAKRLTTHPLAVATFIEELIVRKGSPGLGWGGGLWTDLNGLLQN